MIKSISIKNFKGIGNRIHVDFKPITLLFGANSSGKSSILHAMHYAREIFERRNYDADRTISGGKFVDLGGFEGLVHGPSANETVVIRLDAHVPDTGLPSYNADYNLIGQTLGCEIDSLVKDLETVGVEVELSWHSFREKPFVSTSRVFYNDELFCELKAEENLRGLSISTLNLEHPCLVSYGEVREDDPDLFDSTSAILTYTEHCGDFFTPTDGKPIVLQGGGDALPHYDQTLRFEIDGVDSEFLAKEFDIGEAGLYKQVNYYDTVALEPALTELVVGPFQVIRDQLKAFRYLGPLRETPPRMFESPKTEDPARWASGLAAWDALYNDGELVDSVNEWLDDQKLGCKCYLNRSSFFLVESGSDLARRLIRGVQTIDDEEIFSYEVADLEMLTRLRIVPSESPNVRLLPHDVGVGISQIIPVIVASLHGKGKLVAVEQPELHVHPRIQAELGDLLIEAVTKGENRLVLETHSEHLVLRLLRRIREGVISPDVVGVTYVMQEDGETAVKELNIDEEGDFVDEWPGGFFPERLKEI